MYLLDLFEDIPLVKLMYLVFTRMHMRVTVGNSGLCCVCVTSFELTPLCVEAPDVASVVPMISLGQTGSK